MTSAFPLPAADPDTLGFARKPLAQLDRLIRRHIEEGRYPGCQIERTEAEVIRAEGGAVAEVVEIQGSVVSG